MPKQQIKHQVFYYSMRHYPTVLSADLPHQTKASPVIKHRGNRRGHWQNIFPFQAECQWGKHRRHSETVCFFVTIWWLLGWAGKHWPPRLCDCFCFDFLSQGSEVSHMSKLKRKTLGRLNKHSDVWHLVRHVAMNTATQSCYQANPLLKSTHVNKESHLVT